jgi:mannose-1-phosphate guanylyltransferase/mannose-6-phosphate isomerase
MAKHTVMPVILSGGAGTRLWPLSRSSLPKQFLQLMSEFSLMQETAGRLRTDAFAEPTVICSAQHRFHVETQLREIGLPWNSIVLEPEGRNTAPAAAVAALMATDPNSVIVFLPSDHVITNQKAFGLALTAAIVGAQKGFIVTFGIMPTIPETGYGYIEQGAPVDGIGGLNRVQSFMEKPDRATAEAFLARGGYTWNSGMFVFRADVMLSEMKKHCPNTLIGARKSVSEARKEGPLLHLGAEAFKALPNISIDYAVMEKTDRAAVVPCDIGWSDIGSWSALWELEAKTPDSNVFHGDVHACDVTGTYVHSPKMLTALVGVKDLIVITTDDAVLVADKNSSQDVKRVVDALKAANHPAAFEHKLVHRPWGTYQTVDVGPGYQVKQIVVNPGGRLSLQMHHKRAEHWVVVEGVGQVTCDGNVFSLTENESTFIPLGAKHRLENLSDKTLRLIEVQCGVYLGEDDIVRFDDVYGRARQNS